MAPPFECLADLASGMMPAITHLFRGEADVIFGRDDMMATAGTWIDGAPQLL